MGFRFIIFKFFYNVKATFAHSVTAGFHHIALKGEGRILVTHVIITLPPNQKPHVCSQEYVHTYPISGNSIILMVLTATYLLMTPKFIFPV